MARNSNRKPSLENMRSDRKALLAIRELPDYAPVNPALSTEALIGLEQALVQAEQEQLRLENALNTARNTTAAAAWALRNGILSAKASVIAQYGPDSNAVRSVGLKKKSDHQPPSRRNGSSTS